MARMARVVAPHYPHHVTQRGNRRQAVFFGDGDYGAYLDLMHGACVKAETAVLAYCLMPNHVHLILVPRHEDGLRGAIAEAHRRYTRLVNFREGWRGHLWQERFHSFVMDEAHLAAAIPYVEQNPVRAGLCERAEDWRWSSARARFGYENDPMIDTVLFEELLPDSCAPGSGVAERTYEAIRQHTRTGRPLGTDAFVDGLEALTGRSLKPRPPGPKSQSAQG